MSLEQVFFNCSAYLNGFCMTDLCFLCSFVNLLSHIDIDVSSTYYVVSSTLKGFPLLDTKNYPLTNFLVLHFFFLQSKVEMRQHDRRSSIFAILSGSPILSMAFCTLDFARESQHRAMYEYSLLH